MYVPTIVRTKTGIPLRVLTGNGKKHSRTRVKYEGAKETASQLIELSFTIIVTHTEPLTALETIRVEEILLHHGKTVRVLDPTSATTECAEDVPGRADEVRVLIQRAVRTVIAERN